MKIAIAIVVLLIVLLNSICFGQEKGDFGTNLQIALDLVVAQKNETEDAIKQVRKNPNQANSRQFVPGYMDMSDAFNKAIETVKSGDVMAVSATQNEIGHDVRLTVFGWKELTKYFPVNSNRSTNPPLLKRGRQYFNLHKRSMKKAKRNFPNTLRKKPNGKLGQNCKAVFINFSGYRFNDTYYKISKIRRKNYVNNNSSGTNR